MEKNEFLEIPEYIIKKLVLLYGFCKEIKNKCNNISHPLDNSECESYYLIRSCVHRFKQGKNSHFAGSMFTGS